jgi:hypothetical protein
VNDDILSRFKYLYLSYHRFGQKEAKRGRNVRRRIEFFRKKREKRESYFQVRMVIKEIKREECVL